MSAFDLTSLLPNVSSGLDNTGFLFGAGTSVEAGYPMMAGLTRQVIGALSGPERATLDEALSAAGLIYDPTNAEPNIEIIADAAMAHAINSGDSRFAALETRLRQFVTDVILAVADPKLDHHVRFLELLKARSFGRACCVYVLTTNYDILFELAGAITGVVIETGFVGSVERFFDQQRFVTACGAVQPNRRFEEHPVLTIRLIKLHGSISWVARDGRVFERHPSSIGAAEKRVMVLPRRGKVMDTLQHPHDVLFAVTSRALGNDCKYIASCGFSYGDDHINDNLIAPALTSGKIRLFALGAAETAGIASLKTAPAFSAGFDGSGISSGIAHGTGTDLWKFSKFVELFS